MKLITSNLVHVRLTYSRTTQIKQYLIKIVHGKNRPIGLQEKIIRSIANLLIYPIK